MADDVVHIRQRKIEPLKVGDTVFKSAYDCDLTEKDLEKAALELGETDEKKEACLRKLKEKLSKESNFKYRQDDFYLLRYLRIRKYDVKKAYHSIKFFFEERKKHSNFFNLPPDLKTVQELNFVTILPYATKDGTVIFWMNLDRWNPVEISFEEIVQTTTTLCDIVSMNPHCQINGIIGIWNLSGISMRYGSNCLWNGALLTILSIMQSGYPWRVKKMIVLHTNQLVRFAYSIVRPLLTRKIRERVFLLGSDLTELHQHVDPAVLPQNLMGTLKDEECDMSEHILENLPYIKYERTFISQ